MDKKKSKPTADLLTGSTHEEEISELPKVGNPVEFGQAILTEEEMRVMSLAKRNCIFSDFIAEESMTLINGFRGLGKSWLALCLANEATWGGGLGPWKVEHPVNALIIDGEMPLGLIQDRIKRVNYGRAYKHKPCNLFIYPEAYAYRIGLKRANLLDKGWRDAITKSILALNIGFLVLDNLASLAPGIDENDKMVFDPVNRWLLELRFHKLAIVMTHHVGKSGLQRGTTAHEDHLDLSLLLRHSNSYQEEDGCKFICHITKDRSFQAEGKEYGLELVETEIGRVEFTAFRHQTKGAKLLGEHPSLTKEEAKKMGLSKASFYRAKKELNM